MDRRWGLRLLMIALVVGAILLVAASLSPGTLADDNIAQLAPFSLILVWMTWHLASSSRPTLPMVKQMAAIVALGVVLVVGYSYRDDMKAVFDRALATIVPSRGTEIAPGVMRFQADDSGQFAIDATVDGVGIHFLVDTGASGIALSQHDAKRLGLRPDNLHYDIPLSTANGRAHAAPVTLKAIRIGPLTAQNVRAYVNQGDLDISLLGMSYLSTLGRIEIKGDSLTIER